MSKKNATKPLQKEKHRDTNIDQFLRIVAQPKTQAQKKELRRLVLSLLRDKND